MVREKRRFWTQSDDGRQFEIIEYANIRQETTMRTGRFEVEDSLPHLRTLNGMEVVESEEAGAYQILPLRLTVREMPNRPAGRSG